MTLAPPARPTPPTPRGPTTARAGAPDTVVLGDSTTLAIRTRTRWQRLRWPVVVAVVFVVVVGLMSLLQARTSTTPFAPDNANPNGSRALAQILQDQGVDIHYVRSLDGATSAATAGTTLLIVGTGPLWDEDVAALRQTAADMVLVAPEGYHLFELTDGRLETAGQWLSGGVDPGCDDPDAQAAEHLSVAADGIVATHGSAVLCFPGNGVGAYATVQDGERAITVISDAALMTNDGLAENGNAALLLRALGHHERLTWYIPSLTTSGGGATGPGPFDFLPDGAGIVAVQLGILVLALALWQGRRLGRIVTEPLPVTVRAVEATAGRGRLYRRARSYGHAAAALRAGAAQRLAGRLGLPRTAAAPDVIDAVARASGRSADQVAGVLYGPPPTDDAGLVQLARQLDQLESEVHRT